MNFDDYQKEAGKTAIYPKTEPSWMYVALGLSGETGEIMEKLKKVIRDKKEISGDTLSDIKKEMGDVLWYLSQLSRELGLSFQEIAEENLNKLKSRQERGKLHGSGDNS